MIRFREVEPVVLTAEEAAQYLRLDVGRDIERAVAALNELVDRKGLLKPVMYQRRRMYRRAELDRFLETQQSEADDRSAGRV